MNQWDIEDMRNNLKRHQHPAAPFAQYLMDWCTIVNENSDGWPYWRGGSGAAKSLMSLLDQFNPYRMRDWPEMTPDLLNQFRRALGPIKRACTKHRFTPPELHLDAEIRSA